MKIAIMAELILLLSTLSRFYTLTNSGTTVSVDSYKTLISELPSELTFKLRLAPTTGLRSRLNHLVALYEKSRTGKVTHLEGIGADYNVHTSDICIDGKEIDMTSDASLLEAKAAELLVHFPNSGSELITRKKLRLEFRMPNNPYFDMYKRIDATAELKSEVDDVLDKFAESIRRNIVTKRSPRRPNIEKLANYNNSTDLADWARNSRFGKIIDKIVENWGNNKKDYAVPVSSCKEGEFTAPIIEALKKGIAIVDPKESYYVDIEGDTVTYSEGDYKLFNEPFAIVENHTMLVGYSKFDSCLRVIFSPDMGNYVDISRRTAVKLNKIQVPYEDENAGPNDSTLSEMLNDHEDMLRFFSEDDIEPTSHDNYGMAMDQVVDRVTGAYLAVNFEKVRATRAFNVAKHISEIAKTVAAAQKFRSRSNEYRLGKNGNFRSYTLAQMTGVNDSYETANYVVIYVPEKLSPIANAETEVVTTSMRTMNRNKVEWNIKLPEYLINLNAVFEESTKYKMTDRDISLLMMYLYVNNNPFSTIGEQTRYLFVASTSKKDTTESNFEKKIRPIMKFNNSFMAVHVIKMIKMSEVLTSHAVNGNLDEIFSPYKVYMPAIETPMCSFSASINASYLYTCFNKFATYKLGRSSRVFLDLLDEKKIYSVKEAEIDMELDKIRYKSTNEIIDWIRSDKAGMVKEMVESFEEGPKRFKFNAFMMIAVMVSGDELGVASSSMRGDLLKSPIDACTMRGGMSDSEVNVSCRAAETVYNGMMKSSGRDVAEMTSVSIYTLKSLEMIDDMEYRNRVVDKDQAGSREISVLNYAYRIGALFNETVTRAMAKKEPESVLNDPKKETRFSSLVTSKKYAGCVGDTNDQSRWGANALMELFYISYSKRFDRSDITEMMAHTFYKVSEKKMRAPDNVVRFRETNKTVKPGTDVATLIDRLRGRVYVEFKFSMGQGILHQTSDLYHVYTNRILSRVVEKTNLFSIEATLITSDDCFRLLRFAGDWEDWKKTEDIIGGIMGLMNIIRNPTKSYLSRHIFEFNSGFYNNGVLSVPTVKKAVSEVDCGSGESLITDLLTSASKGTTSLADGASMVIADAVAVASLSLVIDQWNYYKPINRGVLHGGLPMISSIVSLFTGTAGLASLNESPDDVLAAMLNQMYDSQDIIRLKDTIRVSAEDDEEYTRKLVAIERKGRIEGNVIMSKDLAGLVNLVTYKGKITKFSRSIMSIKDYDPVINRYSSTGKDFLFNYKMQFASSDRFGTEKDFFKRYTEPSRSYMSLSYRTKAGMKLNRESLYLYLNNLVYEMRKADPIITGIVRDAMTRAQMIFDVVTDAAPSLEPRSTEENIYPNRVVVDDIAEVSKDSMMEHIYGKVEGSPMERYKLANSVVNSFYGTAPTTVKLKLSMPYTVTLSKAVDDIIKNRSTRRHMRSTLKADVRKSTRAYTEEGEESKLINETVSKMALNMFMDADKRMDTALINNQVAEVLMINEVIPGFVRNKMKKAAAGFCTVSVTEDGMINMMRNKLLSKTSFRVRNGVYRISYPETGTKLAVVSRKDVVDNSWSHAVFGYNNDEEDVTDWRGRTIDRSECIFFAVTDTSTVIMSDCSPMLYTMISNFVIPLFLVEPKNYSDLRSIEEDFGKFAEKRVESFESDFLADGDEILDRAMNDAAVEDSEIIQLLAIVPSTDCSKKVMRIVGQNMLTAYEMKFNDNVDVESAVDFDFFSGALDDMDLDEDPEVDNTDIEIFREETTRVTFIRAMNSLVLVLARLIKEEQRKYKVWLMKELLKKFSKKTVACAVVMSWK